MMQMTEKEIRFLYMRNGCRKNHIKILAELNGVDIQVIESILRKSGCIKENNNYDQ